MPKAQLFATCLVNDLYPEVGLSVDKVLAHLGWELELAAVPLCCGQPAFNAGYRDEARKVALATIKVLGDSDLPLIVPSGSCGDMLSHHLPGLFEPGSSDHARATRLAARVREFSQFLVDDLKVEDLGAKSALKVAYHPSCHLLRGMGVKDQPLKLLRAVEGAELHGFPNQEECCGFGGSFSVTHDRISATMMDEKLKSIASVKPDCLVSCDLGCLMHLEGGLKAQPQASGPQVRHLAQFLAEGLP